MSTSSGPGEAWTAETVHARLHGLSAAEVVRTSGIGVATADEPPVVAAAVRSTFEPEELPPGTEGALARLLRSSGVVETGERGLRWRLDADMRRAVLQRLGGRDAILRACREYLVEDDVVQRTLVDVLEQRSPAWAQRSRDALTTVLEVAEWLHGIVPDAPDPAAVRRELDRELLLEPFRYLVGEHFRGREEELARLSDYVGVHEASSLFERVRRAGRSAMDRDSEPTLVVYGPGGIGKSTLIAKFVLEHAQPARFEQMPFAYLDFDRAVVEADDPASLLIEAAHQLAVQAHVGAGDWNELHRVWSERQAHFRRRGPRTKGRGSPREATDQRAQEELVWQFAGQLEASFSPEMPFLLVLDTFEEVQYRSGAFVRGLWRLLVRLREAIPGARVVVAGRAPVKGPDTRELKLRELDDKAAAGYLQARGVQDPEEAAFIASRLGGSPLTLRLAADLFEQDQGKLGALEDLQGRTSFWRVFAASQESLQRTLYGRILGHVHDPEVERLAHPGLVLRRITPEVIRHVLAEPCGVSVETDDDARRLFEELRREVSLVRPSEAGGLEHRPDLRRLMLPFLEHDEPKAVADIHERAAGFYASADEEDVVARAEEIYHRLARGEDPQAVDARWLPGVEPRLRSAVDELPARAQAYLASRVGVELDDEAWRRASEQDRQRLVEQRARDLLALGQYQEVIAACESARIPPGTGVDLVWAVALRRLGNGSRALTIVDRAVHARSELPVTLALELQDLAAEIELEQHHPERAAARLEEAYAAAKWLRDPAPMLDLAARRLELLRQVTPAGVEAVAAMLHQELAPRLDDERLREDPELAWDIGGQLGEWHPHVLHTVGRAVALPADLDLDAVLDVVREWDDLRFRSLAAAHEVSPRRAITALTSVLELTVPPRKAAGLLAAALREHGRRRRERDRQADGSA